MREISPHVLRHAFITGLATTGQDPWMVQQLARRRSIQTTMGYVHLARTGPQQTAGIAAVEHYLMPQPTPPAPGSGA